MKMLRLSTLKSSVSVSNSVYPNRKLTIRQMFGQSDCLLIITSPAGAVAKYCDEYVCLSVCVSARVSPEPPGIFTNFFVHVAYVRGSVLLRCFDDRPHRLSAGMG